MNTRVNVRKMVVAAMLSAVSSVLMLLDFSVPFAPPFLKLDFSEVPVLICSFAIGPWWGVLCALIKNFVNLLSTTTAGVGELSNFILSSVFVFCAGKIYEKHKTKRRAALSSLAGAALMAAVSIITNYFLVYPAYARVMTMDAILKMYNEIFPSLDSLLKCLVFVNMPFTFLKGIISSVVTILIYKPLSGILKGRK